MELRGLNDKQLQAVKATEGRVRIIAGAGSGKTRVLAHRYAYLVDKLGIDPGNILCLTFTNKAAKEMRDRLWALTSRFGAFRSAAARELAPAARGDRPLGRGRPEGSTGWTDAA